MGWFDNQIGERRKNDNARYEHALYEIRSAVSGKRSNFDSSDLHDRDALAAIFEYYGVKREIPMLRGDTFEVFLEKALESTGLMYRRVELPKGWQKDSFGAMIAFSEDGDTLACTPKGRAYSYVDPDTGRSLPLSSEVADSLVGTAYCFYKPLPFEKLNPRDFIIYMFRSLDIADYMRVIAAVAAVTLIGMFLPLLNEYIFGNVIEMTDESILLPISVMLGSVLICQALITACRSLVIARIESKLKVNVIAAVMMRVLAMPMKFFHKHSTTEISGQITAIGEAITEMIDLCFGASLTAMFSFAYILQMFSFASSLVLPALVVVVLNLGLSILLADLGVGHHYEKMENEAKVMANELGLIRGIQKIKLAGAEKRSFAKWASVYSEDAYLRYGHPGPIIAIEPVLTFVNLAGTIAIFASALSYGITIAEYMAFASAFALIQTACSQVTGSLEHMVSIRSCFKFMRPILENKPENDASRQRVNSLNGKIDIENLTFGYPGQPLLFNNMSVRIKSGEYVAIVGKTGCGKTTLLRLLLGFEEPLSGGIFFDGTSLRALDLKSLRRNIGVVLQEDRLFQGTIFSNIALNAPTLTEDNAWKIAEAVGISDDIKQMNSGMMTLVGEGSSALSGGQKQRVIIARALAPRPKVVLLDEATSALDNISQQVVTETLSKRKGTRIVVAHRLSTIRNCDRILVIDEGRIVQDGKFDDLIAQDGLFRELAEKQRIVG